MGGLGHDRNFSLAVGEKIINHLDPSTAVKVG
jgi:hypothetical protein